MQERLQQGRRYISNDRTETGQKAAQLARKQPRTWAHILSSYPAIEVLFRFHFEAHTEMQRSSWEL